MSNAANLSELTLLLQQWGGGDDEALNKVLPQVYDELYQQAAAAFRHESHGQLLQVTALVNETYLRLAGGDKIHFESRAHFFAVTCRMMRRILVEHARKRQAVKRGGRSKLQLNEDLDQIELPGALDMETLLTLDAAMATLEARYFRAAQVMEWKIFAQLEDSEIAKIMEISTATVKREWRFAKQRLFLFLARSGFST